MRTRLALTWCAGCCRHVPDRSWNQDTYLCSTCTSDVFRLIRRWAGNKVLTEFPIDTILRSHDVV